jgi:hypothetical protein
MKNNDSIYFSRFAIDPEPDIAGLEMIEDMNLLDDVAASEMDTEIFPYGNDELDIG